MIRRSCSCDRARPSVLPRFSLPALFFFLACACASPRSSAQAGIGSGRASAADVASLISDLNAVSMAEGRVTRAATATLQAERQKQLLGEDSNSAGKLLTDTQKWWLENVLNPLNDIARNPASSCDISQKVLKQILAMEAQAQKFGLTDPKFAVFGNPNSVLSKSVQLVKRRCLEEAYDECKLTGNGQALIELGVGFERQLQLLGLEDTDFQNRVAYFFRKCTVYKVKFHSESHMATRYAVDSVIDGGVTMLFEFGEGNDIVSKLSNGKWKGPTKAEASAPDIQVTSVKCTPSTFLTCDSAGALAEGHPIAEGVVKLKRHYTEKILGPDDKPTTKLVESGQDNVSIDFIMPVLTAAAKYVSQGKVVYQNRIEVGGAAFKIAHAPENSPMAAITSWTRQGYPTLFNKQLNGSKTLKVITYSDQSKFELVHRPDLFPRDQINQAYERWPDDLKPDPNKDKIRSPAQPH